MQVESGLLRLVEGQVNAFFGPVLFSFISTIHSHLMSFGVSYLTQCRAQPPGAVIHEVLFSRSEASARNLIIKKAAFRPVARSIQKRFFAQKLLNAPRLCTIGFVSFWGAICGVVVEMKV